MVSNADDWLPSLPCETEGLTVDVGARFHTFFLAAFVLHLAILLAWIAPIFALITHMMPDKIFKSIKFATNFEKIGVWILIALWIVVYLCRLQPSAILACGDGTETPVKTDNLYYEGLFLWWAPIIGLLVVVLSILIGKRDEESKPLIK